MANVPNIFISPLSRRGKKCLKRKERRRGGEGKGREEGKKGYKKYRDQRKELLI